MEITDFDAFNRLTKICGITDAYYDIRGQHHVASVEVKRSLLASMQVNIENDADIQAQLEQYNLRNWQTILPSVLVYTKQETPKTTQLTLNSRQVNHPLGWQIIEENGETHLGDWSFGINQVTQEHECNGIHYYRFDVQLPVLETGYHQLTINPASAPSIATQLIVTPETCYQPDVFNHGQKVWGINLQLYALRSRRNWGIGDFTDLLTAIDILAPLGVDVIGLNPLHTLFAHLPENASPYSPSNRNYLNPVYLDIESIEEFDRCEAARELVDSDDFQANLQALRDADLVQYTGVWKVKLALFRLLYQQFRQDTLNPEIESVKIFRHYQVDKGEDLYKFALFEALQAFFQQQDATIEYWHQWPLEFRDPASVSVKAWAEANSQAIEFHQYLQCRTEQQLSAADRRCQQLDMSIGLYNDLAVGNERSSSSCWFESQLYGKGVSVGAPPDDLGLLGQNWGLPPQIPQQLTDHQYQPFIQTLRANMRHAGALRIDHVMGLMRLYWIPENTAADQGTYIAYPFEDLIGILALESQRNNCLIIGEDLGTVPDEVRHQLWLKKILSYRILFFEKDWDQGSFKAPQEYPCDALCTSGSHDLPTLKGFWQGLDLEIRESLNLFPSDEIKHQQRDARGHDRYQIKLALFKQQLIDEQCLHEDSSELSSQLFLSIQRFLARSESLLMMVPIEDMLSQSNQLNIPGTVDEYPNWRHKIQINLENWREHSELGVVAQAINLERAG